MVDNSSGAGLNVFEAEDGRQSTQMLADTDVLHRLITDISLPGGIDGNDVALKAKDRFGDIPVIYLSGRPDSLRNGLGRRDTYIPKPYRPDVLIAAITWLLPTSGG